ncbi:alpha/beta hydrolase [Corynebacterium pseudopelargi]|nr:alpha/beta hydrolase-fold protein [Corynebacterium pseudopelargi]
MHFVQELSLTAPVVVWAATAVLLASALLSLWLLLQRRGLRTTLLVALGVVASVVAVRWCIEDLWRPFPDAIPWQIYAGAGVCFVAIAALCLARKRVLLVLALALSLLSTLIVGNNVYQLYPTIGSVVNNEHAKKMQWDEFQAALKTKTLPQDQGVHISLPLDSPQSGFKARTAQIYLPPAYWRSDTALPVVVMMAGNPGRPEDWFGAGMADRAADQYQQAHGGVAPIIASVDATGSYTANPGCTDSPGSNVATYLAKDVPEQLKKKLNVDPDQQHWTIGGLSYGGTCALQIATNEPQAYGNFLDFSGEWEPNIGSHEQTVNKLFEGSEEKFKAHNPADLLQAHEHDGRYRHLSGLFIAGDRDKQAVHDLQALQQRAAAAGINSQFRTVKGGHDFGTWRTAFEQSLPWAAKQGGLG